MHSISARENLKGKRHYISPQPRERKDGGLRHGSFPVIAGAGRSF